MATDERENSPKRVMNVDEKAREKSRKIPTPAPKFPHPVTRLSFAHEKNHRKWASENGRLRFDVMNVNVASDRDHTTKTNRVRSGKASENQRPNHNEPYQFSPRAGLEKLRKAHKSQPEGTNQ